MNINHINFLSTLLILIGLCSCSLHIPDSNLNAYLYAVTDYYPIKNSNGVNSSYNHRFLRYRFLLKNDTKETYWLKLRKYGDGDEDTISYVGFSVNSNNKSIDIDSYDQSLSFIFNKGNVESAITRNSLNPGDSACIIIDLQERILDSLGIDKMAPAKSISNMIVFKAHQQIDYYRELKIPNIELVNSNKESIGRYEDELKKIRNQFEVFHDSISNVIYIHHPFE